MAENSPGTDWYDWLAENEEIKGGKVRVLGLPRNPLQLSNSYTDKLFRPAGRVDEGTRDPGGSHDASFEQVLADLSAHDHVRTPHAARAGAPAASDWVDRDAKRLAQSGGGSRGSESCHRNTRSENFQTYMVRREMEGMEERIVERVLLGADHQMYATERRIEQHVNASMAHVNSFLANSEELRNAVKRLRVSNQQLNLRLSELTISLRDEISNTSVSV